MGILRIVTILACLAGTSLGCTSTSECTTDCYAKLAQAGCQTMMQTMGDALQDQNISSFCSVADGWTACLDNTLPTCDQKLDMTTFRGTMDETVNQLCKGSPVDKCRMKVAICAQKMPSDPSSMGPEMCEAMEGYLDCVKEKMKSCDPSVTQQQVVGPMQASFDMQCSAGGGGMCPGIATCLGSLMGGASQGADSEEPAVDIVKQCGVMATALNCLHTERQKCKAKSTRSYTFGDVGGLYTKGCKVMSSNQDTLTCKQFTDCMDTFQFPSDPSKIAAMTSDPQFWCSMMKNVMECGAKSPECSGTSDFASFQTDVNQVCPEAQIMVTPVGSGSIIYPGVLAVIIASLTVLLSTL